MKVLGSSSKEAAPLENPTLMWEQMHFFSATSNVASQNTLFGHLTPGVFSLLNCLFKRCSIGWLKMHDVFRYWLPGHFWEGLYVKWVKLCLLGTPRLPKKNLGSGGQPPLWDPGGPNNPKWVIILHINLPKNARGANI